MKRKLALFLAGIVVLFGLSACSGAKDSADTSDAAATQNVPQSSGAGSFDVEEVRKNIIIKGQPFEVPMALKDLPGGWTWKEHENSVICAKGTALAYLYYNGEEMFVGSLENYYDGAENEGIIYNLTIHKDEENCFIDGLSCQTSTKQDVLAKYGEPDLIKDGKAYYYGIANDSKYINSRINDQGLCIVFLEDDSIRQISITYADLTKDM